MASKRIVIIGGTSAIAQHCARLWADREAVEIILVGRTEASLDRLARDLVVRYPGALCSTLVSSFLDPAAILQTVESICRPGFPDIILIAHGSLPEQRDVEKALSLCHETLEINGISPVLFAEAFASCANPETEAKIVLIGSVAGDRGRKSNYVYGAAKGLIARYAEGLQHRFAGSRLRIILVKPGPTDTPMTERFKGQGLKLAPVETVAQQIVIGIDQGKAAFYAPSHWAIIMRVIRHLPRFIFNRLHI